MNNIIVFIALFFVMASCSWVTGNNSLNSPTLLSDAECASAQKCQSSSECSGNQSACAQLLCSDLSLNVCVNANQVGEKLCGGSDKYLILESDPIQIKCKK